MIHPIHKVLSTLSCHGVRYLLMGGQACILYGGAEFSRDTDIVLFPEEDNWQRLREALDHLQGRRIAVPPMAREYLDKGHAVHFRLYHEECPRLRLDIMTKLRGVDPFPDLWRRRSSLAVTEGEEWPVLSLPDLVRAKKTQRDKDWLMIRRLLEASYAQSGASPTAALIDFWLRESRTPELLGEVCARFPEKCRDLSAVRPALSWAREQCWERVSEALREEESLERALDRAYWAPLLAELAELRHRFAPEAAPGEP